MEPAIRPKRRGLLSSGVVLQRDNARPHISRATTQHIANLRSECHPQPTYSPELAQCDYYVSGPLKEALDGKKFCMEEVKEAIHNWFSLFTQGI